MEKVSIHTSLALAREKLAQMADRPALEAAILLSFVLNKPRSYFYARPEALLDDASLLAFNESLLRRLNGEPIAYIIGTKAFWKLDYKLSQHTLIPRPETEVLVQAALDCYPDPHATLTVADLGTGSGAIALALAGERANWSLHATDICEKALAVAKENALLHLPNRVAFHQGDWCAALPPIQFDMIVSNPPYIAESEWSVYASGLKYEPYAALVSGENGLDAIETILKLSKFYLKKGGYLLIEHGFSQAKAVRVLFEALTYQNIKSFTDDAEHDRVTLGCLP